MDEPQVMGNPFAALVLPPPARLPKSKNVTVVVQGKVLPKARKLRNSELDRFADPGDGDDRERVEAQMRELRRAHQRAKYQRERQKPEAMARRKAYDEAHRANKAAAQARWEEQNREHRRKYRTEWAARKRLMNAEHAAKDTERAREYARKNAEQRRQKRQAMTPEQLAAELDRRRRWREENRDRVNKVKAEWRARKKAEAAAKGGAA